MIEVLAGATFTAVAEDADPGITGTIGVAIEDADNNVISERTTEGIVESAPGIYVKDDLVAPSSTGTYLVIWDDETDYASEELVVVGALALPLPTGGGFGPTALMRRDCTLVRRSASGEVDDYGDEVQTEDLVATICEIQQADRTETGEGAIAEATWRAFFPVATDLQAEDAFIVDGLEFEVVGDPWRADSGSSAVHHLEVWAKRTGGTEPWS